MIHSASPTQVPRHGTLQRPLDSRFHQSSLVMGIGLALAGIVLLPGTMFVIEHQIEAGEALWMEYIFPFACLVGSGLVLAAGIAQSIDAEYCRRKMQRWGKVTRARILGYYLDDDRLGVARYAIYEYDVVGKGAKVGRYIVREMISDDLFHRLEKQEYALIQYLPNHPTVATLDIDKRI